VDQESLTQVQQIVGSTVETLRGEIAEAKRHTGVLTEGLRHELQVVTDGFQMHLDRRHTNDRGYLDEQFRETTHLSNFLMASSTSESIVWSAGSAPSSNI